MNTAFWKGTRYRTKPTSNSLIEMDGSLSRSSTEVDTYTSICVGQEIQVGEFFWIPDHDFIGYDRDAYHGHCLDKRSPGSVDHDCTLTIRAIKNGYAIVRLNRPQVPYGAPAPIGTVFQLPLSQMARWAEMTARREDRERQRRSLEQQYCR